MSDNFDVIAIGGGPAGSAAAIKCAQNNLSVAIVEAESFPRSHPGETLHPGIEPLLESLGVAESVLGAGFLRHQGNWVDWNGDRQFMPFGADETGIWQGFQAWRADFDAILLDRARSLGVKVFQPCRALQPIISRDRQVTGVKTTQGDFGAFFTIDASGSRHWLTRQLGWQIHNYSPRLIARYGYVEGDYEGDLPISIGSKGKWTWLAEVRPQLYQWTKLIFDRQADRDRSIPQEFAKLKPKGSTKVADVTWRISDRPAGSGYFLVGDAAAVLDPASSHGVLKAIMSGIMAAYLIDRVVNHRQSESAAAMVYNNWLNQWFQHDVAKLKEFYRIL